MSEICRPWREQLGAYALGHLGPDERAAAQAHLDGCPACRAEAAELTRTAARLAEGDPERVAAGAPAPPPDLGDRVLARVGRERRTRRTRRRRGALRVAVAAAAAALALAASAVALWPEDRDEAAGPAPAATETVSLRNVPAGMVMRAELTPRAWGTQIDVLVKGARGGIECRVVVIREDGERVPAGSFRYADTPQGTRVTLASSVPRAEAVAIELRAGRWVYPGPLR